MTNESQTETNAGGSLHPLVQRLAHNWRLAVSAHKQLRAEYWRDGEVSLWMTSYVFAPVAWVMCGGLALYYAVKDRHKSLNDEALRRGEETP